MRENLYYEEYKGQGGRAPAMSFDRIFCGGAVCAAGYLVGQARCYAEEAVFALSDHYGLMALVDVNEVHGGSGERGSGVAGRRREGLGMARDQAVLQERVVVKELQAAALEQARQQRTREEEEEGARRRRAERRRLAEERRARYEEAFGREKFWATLSRVAVARRAKSVGRGAKG